jgi:hypothetical protein
LRAWASDPDGTTAAITGCVRDLMMPSDLEMMRELERSELRRLEPAPGEGQQVARIRIRRITVTKPAR